MITTTIICIVLAVLLLRWESNVNHYESIWRGVTGVILIIVAFFMALVVVVNPYGVHRFIAGLESQRATLEAARLNGSELEVATATRQAMDLNGELARIQYDNTVWFFDSIVPDEIMLVEPIK
jgi:hypothetical protein